MSKDTTIGINSLVWHQSEKPLFSIEGELRMEEGKIEFASAAEFLSSFSKITECQGPGPHHLDKRKKKYKNTEHEPIEAKETKEE